MSVDSELALPPERHEASTPTVVRGAANLPADQWSALSDNPYEKPEWFRFNEACFPEMRFVYFCIYEDGKLQAVLPAYDRHSPLYCNSIELLPRATDSLLQGMRFLISGSPTSFCSDLIGPHRYAVTLTRFAWSYAVKNGFDLLSLPFCRSRVKQQHAYTGRSMVDYNLQLPFNSFDGYLKSLSSSRRYNVRRDMRDAPPITHLPLAGHEDVMHRLYRITADKHDAKGTVTPDFYQALVSSLGDKARLALAGDPADPTGAQVYFQSRKALWLFHVGIATRDRTYFNLAYYESIRLATERGLKFINFRPSTDEAKLTRGCRPEHLYVSCLPASPRGHLCLRQVKEVCDEIRHMKLMKHGGAAAENGRSIKLLDSNDDRSFSWKVRYRMRTDRSPLLVEVQNKFTVREYARARGVRMAPLYSVMRDAADLFVEAMPDNCFVKASHASGWNVMRKLGDFHLIADSSTHGSHRHLQRLSDSNCLKLFGRWLDTTFSHSEWAYSVMQKHILVEQILQPRRGPELMDYRFYTFDGQVKAINVGSSSYRLRNQNAFFNSDWQLIPLTCYRESLPDPLPERPETLDQMLDIASRLGTGLDFVRVDLFDTDDGVMLGEMTIYPEGGRVDSPTACPVFNQWLGRQWRLGINGVRVD